SASYLIIHPVYSNLEPAIYNFFFLAFAAFLGATVFFAGTSFLSALGFFPPFFLSSGKGPIIFKHSSKVNEAGSFPLGILKNFFPTWMQGPYLPLITFTAVFSGNSF